MGLILGDRNGFNFSDVFSLRNINGSVWQAFAQLTSLMMELYTCQVNSQMAGV
jgi:hypothetical protein